MEISEVLKKGGKKRARKRVGRGRGSGLGKTSGRGHKGAHSRSGFTRRYAHEGGQMPLVRRVPKRGFSNYLFRKRFDVVNLNMLEAKFESGDTVSLQTLEERGVLKSRHGRLKVLGHGELTKNLTVVAAAASASAKEKIAAAGGKVEVPDPPKKG